MWAPYEQIAAPKEGNPKREEPGDPVPIDEPGESDPLPAPPDEPTS